eukprot:TRINITY_DN12441_c0_g1_i3.p1 TRINITY_DN12441_c0_g1~~TRINITY_DN12441_c0_g1_i3.p1  ORF type:complete len:125 (+),score=15.94 TRINITY_DN12441_c0_g1_i3:109-483(+)
MGAKSSSDSSAPEGAPPMADYESWQPRTDEVVFDVAVSSVAGESVTIDGVAASMPACYLRKRVVEALGTRADTSALVILDRGGQVDSPADSDTIAVEHDAMPDKTLRDFGIGESAQLSLTILHH